LSDGAESGHGYVRGTGSTRPLAEPLRPVLLGLESHGSLSRTFGGFYGESTSRAPSFASSPSLSLVMIAMLITLYNLILKKVFGYVLLVDIIFKIKK